MPQVIPITNSAKQAFTALGFDFEFYWNDTDSAWRMNLSQNGVVLFTGLRLVINIFILNAYGLGIGDFFIINNESISEDPTRDAWDDGSFSMLYYTEAEKDEAISAAS